MSNTSEELTVERPKLQLSGKQVLASALAATSTSVASSTLGVTGTVVGAGVVSVISVTAGAVYNYSIDRTAHEVRRVTVTSRALAQRGGRTQAPSGAALPPADGLEALGAPDTRTASTTVITPARERTGGSAWSGRRRPVGALALVGLAAGIFGGVVGLLGTVEAATGRSVDSIVTGSTSTGGRERIFGAVTPGAGSSDEPEVATTPTPSPTATDSAGEPVPTQSPQPTESAAPSVTPTDVPSVVSTPDISVEPEPTETPTESPTSDEPVDPEAPGTTG